MEKVICIKDITFFIYYWVTDRALKMVWLPAMAAFADGFAAEDRRAGVQFVYCWCWCWYRCSWFQRWIGIVGVMTRTTDFNSKKIHLESLCIKNGCKELVAGFGLFPNSCTFDTGRGVPCMPWHCEFQDTG